MFETKLDSYGYYYIKLLISLCVVLQYLKTVIRKGFFSNYLGQIALITTVYLFFNFYH